MEEGSVNLTPPESFSLSFDGRTIREVGEDGPHLVDVRLYDEHGIFMESKEYSTQAYAADTFERPPVALTGVSSDHAVDSDGNGLFDWLVIDLETEVTEAGDYAIHGWLYDDADEVIDIVSTSSALEVGTSTVSLQFDGREIGKHAANGPYLLDYLAVRRQGQLDDGYLATREELHATGAYLASQFEGFTAVGAGVVGRHIFYNNSAFDGDNSQANELDDDALAFDKEALRPGGTATFANYTSYDKGINGVMVDIAGMPGTPTVADFEFRVGNDDDLVNWSELDVVNPPRIDVRAGQGIGGSDRVTIIIDDNVIQNQWLQVTVLANEHTGLAAPDVFYFGNAPGEAGDSAINTIVNATDEIVARNFQHSAVDQALIDDPHDYNRDSLVNGTDQIIARNNQTNPLTMLKLITAPVQDAALKQAAELEVSEPTTLPGDLDWLYEFEQMHTKNARHKRSSVEEAVDMLIATESV